MRVGTDLIEVSRVRASLERTPSFAQKVYTAREVAYCEGRGGGKYESYAGRFAGKEAVLKALWLGIRHSLREVEILNEESGRPRVILHGKTLEYAEAAGVEEIEITISHTRELAQAVALVQ